MSGFKWKYNWMIGWLGILVFSACSDFFDLRPTNYIDDENAWSDPQTVNAILADLYARINYEDFDYYEGFWVYSQLNLSSASDESYPSWQQGEFGLGGKTQVIYGDSWFYHWPYDQIRNCNSMLQKLNAANIPSEQKELIRAEVRFVCAYHYFLLVKRFGGVPLIMEAQEYNPDRPDDLEVARDKEQTIYDFILSEMDDIVPVLPVKRSVIDRNRVSRYAAFALKSRAALYAASIAQYGKTEPMGLTGIAADAKPYWLAASVAADSVIRSGQYALYQQYDDKTENYNRLFLDKNNNEYIWSKEYHLPEAGHSFDHSTTPYSFTGGYGCGMTPTLEMVEAYEYTDGSDGKLQTYDADTKNFIEYENPLDLFTGKDPRLFASVYLPMSKFKDGIVEIRRGIYYKSNDSFRLAPHLEYKALLADGSLIYLAGKDGIIPLQDPSKTGFYQKKFYDERRSDFSEGKSDQTWPVFRLAEMYLNKAEAEMELGHTVNAVDALNRIRERAGIKQLSQNEITLNRIRNERRIELAFENHRFWDLRRWRIATSDESGKGVLNPLKPTALWPCIVYENGAYIFMTVSGS
ncbi:MAG: RagB/SusD family nutrient uptake outer membrane protein, partial [Candidatus Symbiothrix sp.]|nr:RagB/SusD family nutrient uptake outer membrane protein [Candidatus Symbiothrix sp.]